MNDRKRKRNKHTKGGFDDPVLDRKFMDWHTFREFLKDFGTPPNNVDGQFTWRTEFYRGILRNIIKGLVKIESCPETWDKDYLLDRLFFDGRLVVTDTSSGVLPLRCSVYGVNVFDRSSGILVNNPVLGDFERTRDVDAILMYLMDDKIFRNYTSLVDIFAEKLASCDSGIDVNIMNTKVTWIVRVNSSKQADEMKMIYDKVSRGEPAVFYDAEADLTKDKVMDFFGTQVKNNYVCDLLQTEKRAIMSEFLTIIGINNTNIEKKERLLVDEVNSNNDEIYSNCSYIRANIEKAVEGANKMFPNIGWKITFPYWKSPEERREEEMKYANDVGEHSGLLTNGESTATKANA